MSLALVMGACADKSSDGTDSGGQGSGTSGSSTTAVSPTMGGASDGGSETGVGPGTTTDPGLTTDPGPTTGGDGDAALMGSCMDACGRIFECVADLPGTLEDCMAGCLEQWGGPECGQTGIDFLQCLVGMNCKQLGAYVEQDKPGVCAEAADAADAVCGGASTCMMGGSAGMNECSVSRDCGDGVEEFQCDGALCTCVVDGVPGESCMDEGVCALDLEGQSIAAEDCCGWVWS